MSGIVFRPILFLFGQCTLLKWAFVNILECKLHNSISVKISFVCRYNYGLSVRDCSGCSLLVGVMFSLETVCV